MKLAPGESRSVRLRLTRVETNVPFRDFDSFFERRIQEADDFYASIQNRRQSSD